MDALKSLVQPLIGGAAGSSLMDASKLVILGGTVETARRVSSSAWSHFVNSFFLTASFSDEDMPYEWLMLWLSRRPEWQRSREFETTTRTTTVGLSARTNGGTEIEDDEQDDPEDELVPGKQKLKVVFQPTFDSNHTIFWRGHWLRVRRTKRNDGTELLTVSVVARSNSILKQLVLQAKKDYEAEAVHRVQIYFADSHGSWRWTDSRHKRPMSSIVLNPGVKEMLLADARDFLRSEKWYANRGIPFRRGYLLHGVPGSGKTSLIHSLAGELMLDIYVVSLSASWINDATLTTLMGRVPARCILLLEDLDAAFTRSTTRDEMSTGAPSPPTKEEASSNTRNSSSSNQKDILSDTNTLSLSGLLNSLDGVAAAEGRLLFATTNHLDRLDPALSRPGRLDVWVEFRNASKWQSECLFRNFFPSAEAEELALLAEETQAIEAGQSSEPTSPSIGSSVPSDTLFAPPPMEHSYQAPLTASRLCDLAKKFAEAIPEDEFSVAALQGWLLTNKTQPETAALGAASWVKSEREMKERLAREKEERERKERIDRERRRRELIEKEERERAERDIKQREVRREMEAEERRQLEVKVREEQEAEREAKAKAELALVAKEKAGKEIESDSSSVDPKDTSSDGTRESTPPESVTDGWENASAENNKENN